jgi:hypothetical protein
VRILILAPKQADLKVRLYRDEPLSPCPAHWQAGGIINTRTWATAVAAGLLLQPKTRRPVPVQQVPYDAVASLEVPGKGIGAGKAAAIGVAAGAGAFWAMVGIALAIWSD